MNSQHLSDDLCLDYLSGELPLVEIPSFECHLDQCSECRRKVEEYGAIFRSGIAAIAGDVVNDAMSGSVPWSVEEGERRLYAAIRAEAGAASPRPPFKHETNLVPQKMPLRRLANFLLSSNLRANLAAAASLVLVTGLAMSVYRIGLKRGQGQSHVVIQSDTKADEALRAQVEKLTDERALIEASLRERETIISGLRAQIKEQRIQMEALGATLQSTNEQAQEQVEESRQVSSQRDEIARKFEDQKATLAAEEKKFDNLQQAETNDAVRIVSLENQIQQMAQLSKDREGTIDEQQRMLAADRDIRDLMGARDLYIAEVYDVGGNGKRKKPYGRVFYTKGKSLIFYAYDLDQQPGLKSASTFQAWGLRGPDKKTALNLGVMYIDNSANKRWVLKFDDPKALEEINAVFVTVEPNGGSRVPQGQQVLFAYLKEEPNHP